MVIPRRVLPSASPIRASSVTFTCEPSRSFQLSGHNHDVSGGQSLDNLYPALAPLADVDFEALSASIDDFEQILVVTNGDQRLFRHRHGIAFIAEQ